MQVKSMITFLTSGLILLGMNQSVFAHTYLGSLGSGVSATDYFEVDCTTPPGTPANLQTTQYSLNIQDRGADSNLVGIIAFNANAAGNTKSYTAIDPAGGATGTPTQTAPSPTIKVPGGEGIYRFAVFKTGSSAQQYFITVHCENANGTETNAIGMINPPAVGNSLKSNQ
jgi:hypothetical protein